MNNSHSYVTSKFRPPLLHGMLVRRITKYSTPAKLWRHIFVGQRSFRLLCCNFMVVTLLLHKWGNTRLWSRQVTGWGRKLHCLRSYMTSLNIIFELFPAWQTWNTIIRMFAFRFSYYILKCQMIYQTDYGNKYF